MRCHLSFGGVQRTLHVPPTSCPQQVWPQVEGNSVSFKVVNPSPSTGQRSVTIDLYMREGDALQAMYLGWDTTPSSSPRPFGFTGQQVLTMAGGHTFAYWCERLQDPATSTAAEAPVEACSEPTTR